MSNYLTPIDIMDLTTIHDLLALVEEVKTTKQPRLLTRASETMAILMPPATTVTPKPSGIWAQYDPKRVRAALKTSAGALHGVDRTQLLTDLTDQRSQESLGRDS